MQHLVVPWPADDGSDVVARLVAQPLGERLNQTMIIDNRPGANGANGAIDSEAVARAAKDGYTLARGRSQNSRPSSDASAA